MNCANPTGGAGRIWANVYVCSDCAELADKLLANGVSELNKLVTLLKETIRVMLVEGKITHATLTEQPDRAHIFKQIVSLKSAAEARRGCSTHSG